MSDFFTFRCDIRGFRRGAVGGVFGGPQGGKSLAKVRLTRPQSDSVLSLLKGAEPALAFNNKGANRVLLTTGTLCVCVCVCVHVYIYVCVCVCVRLV